MAKSGIRPIHVSWTIENLMFQHTGGRNNDFASSPHESNSPPRMKIGWGYFHVSINNDEEPQGCDAVYNGIP
jgi:hypothetical protein